MISKRRYKRVPISGIATLVFEKKGQIYSIETVIANIALRGIGLYSYNSIEAKTGVSITIDFISKYSTLKTDPIEGCVICNKQIDNTYFIGIQFNEEINVKNQPSLFEQIQNISV
jgi:hypothetical protein